MKFHYVFFHTTSAALAENKVMMKSRRDNFSYYLRSPGRKQGHDEKSWVPELGPSQKTHTTSAALAENKVMMKSRRDNFSYYLRGPGRKQGHDEKSWVPELGYRWGGGASFELKHLSPSDSL